MVQTRLEIRDLILQFLVVLIMLVFEFGSHGGMVVRKRVAHRHCDFRRGLSTRLSYQRPIFSAGILRRAVAENRTGNRTSDAEEAPVRFSVGKGYDIMLLR